MQIKLLIIAFIVSTFSSAFASAGQKLSSVDTKLEIAVALNWVSEHLPNGIVKKGATVSFQRNFDPQALLLAGYTVTEVYTQRDLHGKGCVLMVEFDNDSKMVLAYTITDPTHAVWEKACD